MKLIFCTSVNNIESLNILNSIVLNVQLEYAALDAAVLIRIFSHVSGEGGDKFEWQSYIVSDFCPYLDLHIIQPPHRLLWISTSLSAFALCSR